MLLYRLLSPFLILVVLARSIWAILRRTEKVADLAERFWPSASAHDQIWIHAASVGEVNSVKAIIAQLAQGNHVMLTTSTPTGRDTAKSWEIAKLQTRLAPHDLGWLTHLFISRNNIKSLVIVENELWPARILACQSRGLPVVMINARMSQGTFKTWQNFPKTADRLFSRMNAILPQDQGSADRICAIGAPKERIGAPLNLKSLYVPDETPLPQGILTQDRSLTVLAAATHEGEDQTLIDAFEVCRAAEPELRLIIAPRHPNRAKSIKDLSERAGFTTICRTQDQDVSGDVYIADTLGEMHLWYRIAGVAFVGGSLVDRGGHTPYEPAAHGCPIIHGPSIYNFENAYAEVTKSFPVWQAADTTQIAKAISDARIAKVEPFQSAQQSQDVLETLEFHLAPKMP